MKTNKNDLENVLKRISTGAVIAKDIKYDDRLTVKQISEIPSVLVFSWIQNKLWTNKDFVKWLDSFSYEE